MTSLAAPHAPAVPDAAIAPIAPIAPAVPAPSGAPAPSPAAGFHRLRVRAVRPDTDDALVVDFEVPEALREAFRFVPGQYLTLRRDDADGDGLRRSYSICAGATEDDGGLRVGIRRVEGGAFSTWAHAALRAGDWLQAMPPAGRFGRAAFEPEPEAADAGAAPRPAARHFLAIASGSGITPILSIAKTVLAREPSSRFTLIYGNRSVRSAMFKEEIEDLKNRYLSRLALHHVFSREHMDSPLQAGRLDRDKLAGFLGPLVDPASIAHAFVCGPHGANDEAEAALRAAGVPADRIHVERFGAPAADAARGPRPPAAPRPGDAAQARVTVLRDGIARRIDFAAGDGNILDAAARAGLEVPYSCKSGVCATCRARVTAGEVRMERNFSLEPGELARGFVLTCQAVPLTPEVTVSFDER
ncbi:MAG: phenylacetate-CoA oxygenase/reductase subunit PaaK [Xylophilus ampelinus]